MESGIKRTQRDYTLAFKLSVVEQVEKVELTYKRAQERYGIQERSTVLVWLRKHGRQSWGSASSRAEEDAAMELFHNLATGFDVAFTDLLYCQESLRRGLSLSA